MYISTISSPVGPLTLESDGQAITGLYFQRRDGGLPGEQLPLHRQAAAQLAEYFAGRRKTFSLPLAPRGTEFQRLVWQALLTIPYGETRSYGEIAAAVGRPRACRAVGMANHRNPISILIPCHRVIGSGGALVGYGGGLAIKEALLRLEREHKGQCGE